MRIPFFLLLCCFFTKVAAQNTAAMTSQNKTIPHLSSTMLKDGLIILSFKEAWKYQKGDDLKWRELDFDDTLWHQLSPERLLVRNLADSTWQGYGWWRLPFTADSAFCNNITRLHFRSWGAAEVYLDGQLISTYGTFSSLPTDEKNYVPRYVLDNAIKILPAEKHLLAIRFANHAAKKNEELLKHNAAYAGFTIGFANEAKAVLAEKNYSYYVGAHSIITVILLLLILLHTLLFSKFPKDASNLAIIGVVFLFLLSVATNYAGLFIELTSFRNSLLRGIINSAAFGLGLVLLPYTLSLIFRLDKFSWTKHLAWLVVLRSVLYFFPIIPTSASDSILIALVLFAIGYILFQAKKSKKEGLIYLTIGAIGTTIFILIDRLYATNVIQLSDLQFYSVLVFTFICFPVSLSLYITSRYGTLFSAMEQEVTNRTFDLNRSLKDLQATQVSLSAKNAENELLLKEIHHRVKNNLEIVSSLLELQSAQIDDPSVQAAMLSSQNRVHSMGIIHQKLYQGEHLATIEMRDYFTNLSRSILNSFNADGKIKVECNMPELVLDVDTAISIGLITNELITNSLKYAFEGRDSGTIKISLNDESTKGGMLLKIADDGIGKQNNSKSKGTGFGTQLVSLLTKQLDGQLTYENLNGTTVSLYFKQMKVA